MLPPQNGGLRETAAASERRATGLRNCDGNHNRYCYDHPAYDDANLGRPLAQNKLTGLGCGLAEKFGMQIGPLPIRSASPRLSWRSTVSKRRKTPAQYMDAPHSHQQ